MNKVFLIVLLGIPFLVFSQTGLNTRTPEATLDISKGQNTSPQKGVLIPNITGNNLALIDNKYGVEQHGAMIFVTQRVSEDAITPKTSEVTQKGMYVYHHMPFQRWRPTVSGKSAVTADKVFVIISSAANRLMTSNTEAIRWSSQIEGVNNQLISLTNGNTDVILPPFRTIKIQGMIPIGFGPGSEAQKKIASSLRSDINLVNPTAGAVLYSSSPGFARSSSYTTTNQGGATPAFMIVYTGNTGAVVRVNATREAGVRTNIAGGPAHNTIGSYLILEEI